MSRDETTAKPREMPVHLSNVYNDAVSNLQFLKTQQWNLTNYTVLVFAGLVALGQNVQGLPHLDMMILGVAVGSGLLLLLTEWSKFKFRRRVFHLYDTFFSDQERAALRLRKRAGWTYLLSDWPFLLAFIVIISGGAWLSSQLIAPNTTSRDAHSTAAPNQQR